MDRAARAASNALATACAWLAAPWAWVEAAFKNPAYGTAAAVIACDAGPCHDWPASPEVTAENEDAAEPNSADNPSQAAAASSIGAEPAPLNISRELISGGNIGKLTIIGLLPVPDRRHHDWCPEVAGYAQDATAIARRNSRFGQIAGESHRR